MNTNFKLLLLLLICSAKIFAQNSAIILTPKYQIYNNPVLNSLPIGNPNTTSTADPSNGYFANFKAKSSQNIQVDAQGKILFFIVDGYIFGRSGQYLGLVSKNIGSVSNVGPAYADGVIGETMIIPSPDCSNSNVFFIVSSFTDNPGSVGITGIDKRASYDKITISYDVFDNLIPGSGILSTQAEQNGYLNMSINDFSLSELIGGTYFEDGLDHCNTPYFAASKVINGTKRYLYMLNNDKIFRFKIENGQFTYDNYVVDLDTYFYAFTNCFSIRSELELVTLPNGDLRLAFPMEGRLTIASNFIYGYATLDFSSSSGNVVTNSLKTFNYSTLPSSPLGIANFVIKGAELSPDGSKLYLTHPPLATYNGSNAYNNTLDVIDLATMTRTNLSAISDFKDSQIESSIGGKLIIPTTTGVYEIANPNTSTPTLTSVQALSNYLPTSPYSTSYSANQSVRLLQDQIDGEDYSTYGNNTYTINTFTATTNATWTGSLNPFNNSPIVYVRESLTIPAGKIITMSGMTFKFAPNARLIIENGYTLLGSNIQGGKLTINNTVLTSFNTCGENLMWHGVEVWGNSSLAQGTLTTSQQGRLIIQGTNSKIENSKNGVAARATNPINNAVVSGKYGGIIQAANATFLNNQNDAILTNYISGSTNNLSKFTNCIFKTTSGYSAFALPLGNHITLNTIQGISILGCDFINEDFNSFAIDKQGVGIASINASFFADKRCSLAQIPCTPDDPNTFTNLTYGIGSITFSGSLTFRSDGNVFENNALGISVSGTKSPRIVRNTFRVREILSTNPIINQSSGIYLSGSNSYTVEENSFEQFDNPAINNSAANSFGIVVNNSGPLNNRIYRYVFENLKVGGQSESQNGSINVGGNGTGLVWKCNQFSAPIYSYDLAVMSGTINYHQGYISSSIDSIANQAAANNKFSQDNESLSLTHDFFVSQSAQSANINYVDYANDSFYDLDSYTTNMIGVSNAQYNGNDHVYDPIRSCRSNFSTGQVYMKAATNQQAQSNSEHASSAIVLDDNFIQNEQAMYELSIKNLEIQTKLQEILLDTLLENKNATLIEFLSQFDDEASLKMLAELQIGEKDVESVVNSLQNEKVKFSQDFIDLLKIKAELLKSEDYFAFMNEKENQEYYLKRLSEIAENKEDVLTAHQASILVSFSKPLDLTYHFLEAEEGGEKSMKIPTSNTESKSNLIVYPNPVKNKLAINLALAENEQVSATIFSVLGNTMGTWELSNENNGIDVNHFQGGVYLIHVNNAQGENIQTLRFVKQ